MSEGARLERLSQLIIIIILHSHSPHTIQIINTLNFRNHYGFFFTHYINFINKEMYSNFQPCLLKLSIRVSTKWIIRKKTKHDLSVYVGYERTVRWSIVDRI